MAVNAFTFLPADLCGDLDLPDFPASQDCTSYPQLNSEVCGIIVRPEGASAPVTWYSLSEWYDEGKIDNTDPAKAHYIMGIGSFLPTQSVVASLAGGRVEETRERTQRLILNVLNMDAGHIQFGRDLQRNNKNFTFYVVTIGGTYQGTSNPVTNNRIISNSWAGVTGMKPSFVDCLFSFNEGENSKESMSVIIDTEFLEFPAMPLPM